MGMKLLFSKNSPSSFDRLSCGCALHSIVLETVHVQYDQEKALWLPLRSRRQNVSCLNHFLADRFGEGIYSTVCYVTSAHQTSLEKALKWPGQYSFWATVQLGKLPKGFKEMHLKLLAGSQVESVSSGK